MNNKTAKQIVTGYRIKCALVVLFYAVALALLILLMARNMFFGTVCVVLLGVSIKAPFDKLREKDLESVIYEGKWYKNQ